MWEMKLEEEHYQKAEESEHMPDVGHHLAGLGSNHGDWCTAGKEGLHLECKLES